MPAHVCPITDIETPQCGATSCMWHSTKSSTGCMHALIRHDSVTKAEILQYKPDVGFTQAKDRIQMVLVLDRYVTHIGNRGSTPVPESLRHLCEASPLMRKDLFPGLSFEALQAMCLMTNFTPFAARLPNKPSLSAVLFLSPGTIERILNHQELP